MKESSSSNSRSRNVTCARNLSGNSGNQRLGIAEVFALNSAIVYAQTGQREIERKERDRVGERRGRDRAGQTHLKTLAPSRPRRELSALLKFMRRMQQQYVQQQQQLQQLQKLQQLQEQVALQQSQNGATQTKPTRPHGALCSAHKKDQQGKPRRRFLPGLFMLYCLKKNVYRQASGLVVYRAKTGKKAFARLRLRPRGPPSCSPVCNGYSSVNKKALADALFFAHPPVVHSSSHYSLPERNTTAHRPTTKT